MSSRPKPRILLVATSSLFVRVFLEPQIRFLTEQGFDVFLACGRDERFKELQKGFSIPLLGLPLSRTLNPFLDLCSLSQLLAYILWIRPAIVHTHTPKAGLIGMLASRVARVGHRIHTFHGLRSETLKGYRLKMVRAVEEATTACATSVLAVSESLRTQIIRDCISPEGKIKVLGKGSCSGIDLDTFNCGFRTPARIAFRQQHGIPQESLLISYVGRIAHDKGVTTLREAWTYIRREHPSSFLLLAGPNDTTDPVTPDTLEAFCTDVRVRFLEGFTEHAATILAASDIAVQPSYREGLGVAALEASAMGLPVVASRTTGLVDAIIPGHTGLLTTVADAQDLSRNVGALLSDWQMRINFGMQGRHFVADNFRRADVLQRLVTYYRSLTPHLSLSKRVLDICLASIGLVVCAPIVAAAAIVIRLKMGSPILFRQSRAGLNGQSFTLLKLRTMAPESCSSAERKDEQRLTSMGRILRKLSVDEIPQLINVLKGEMSLVGPRPLLLEYLPRYSAHQMRRHEVLPGITGWTQVHGRNRLSWEDKFSLDIWYVDHQSMLLDLRILLQTFRKVMTSSDITPQDRESVPEFLGSQSAAL